MDTDALYQAYVDTDYAVFTSKLTKNRDLPYRGIRIPVLRKLAKELDDFPYEIKWHEDVLLKGFWIASRKIPFSEKRKLIEEHLGLLETWDEVDTLASSIKPTKKDKDEIYTFLISLLKEERVMPRRLGIVTLLLKRKYFPERTAEMLASITAADREEYYISMAVAWALASFILDDSNQSIHLVKVSDATRKRAEQKIRDSLRERKSRI